ncbi:MAG: Ppx/GppA family phosphatase [Anaerolineae bacterium]|nr:Ppx/GppA family phosphatase [Anaerolineae bacterium]
MIDSKHLLELHEIQEAERMAQRVAVIDMGSNSFRLVVFEYVPGVSFKEVDEVRENPRLSEGMAEMPVMRQSAIDRGVRAAQIYAAYCRASGIDDIICVGTSAIRDAENRSRFLQRVQDEAGLAVRVLSGEEEAYYAYLAAANSMTLRDGLVLNLGGGSLEIVRVEDRRSVEATSLPLGAVRMTEAFLTGDPPTSKQIEKLTEHVQTELAQLDWFRGRSGMQMIGQGGTLRLIARLVQKRNDYPLDILHGFEVADAQIESVRKELAKLSVSARTKLAGMKPDRADISLGGLIVMQEAMHVAGFDKMTICVQGLREGLFYERFLGDGAAKNVTPLLEDVRRESVMNLAHNYRYQEHHAQHIAMLTLSMFDQIPQAFSACKEGDRELLWAASILHDIGMTIDYHDHHKHGAYLILNDALPGFSQPEVALIALMVRYHRKGNPTLDEFAPLFEHEDEHRLLQMAALLRLAEQLDRSRDGAARAIELRMTADSAIIKVTFRGDEQVLVWAAQNHRDVFEQAFGMPLEIVAVPET